MSTEQGIEAHPIADIFPSMSPEDYIRLSESIRRDGLLEPIWLYEGAVLDGRHRYKACQEFGVEPRFETFEGSDDDAMTFSIAVNLNRRHMTTEQKAALAVSIKAYESERARARHQERAGRSPVNGGNISTISEDTGKARDKAGEAVGVSGRSVDDAEKVAAQAPDVFERMKQGQYGNLATAKKVAELPEEERAAIHEEMDSGVPAREAVKARSPHVTHNTGNNEWYTPEEYIAAARQTLGDFDLDPASSPIANATVQAERFYTAEEDGLSQPWFGRVWMNPPYEAGLVDKFAQKLRDEYQAGTVSEAIVLVNNATETRWFHTMVEVASAVCFPKGRIRFTSPNGVLGAPLQGQAFIYLGQNVAGFAERFNEFGFTVVVAGRAV
jgi:phage N-6-adenine-methyltransferase